MTTLPETSRRWTEADVRAACQCDRPGCDCHKANGKVHCPAHDDARPSLRVRTIGGTLLLTCWSQQCRFADIIAGLGERGLRPPRPVHAQNGRASTTRPPQRIGAVRRWKVYQDIGGPVSAVHCRQDYDDGGKRIWWEHPDGTACTRDHPCPSPTTFLLYGSHGLGETRDAVIAEGEPACDALTRLGQAALGTYGANVLPSDAGLRPLLGLDRLFLWPDHDEPGQQHMQAIGARLRALGFAGELRVVVWADATPKADAADFVASGATPDELGALLEAAQPYQRDPAAGSDLVLDIVWMHEVTAKLIEWLWLRWLAKGKLHILGGLGGIGKGTLMAALAAQFSTGKGTLPDGTKAPERALKTLFLLSEDSIADTLKPRLELHGADVTNIAAMTAVRSVSDDNIVTFDLAKHLPMLEARIRTEGFELVVIDALSDAMPGSERNSEGAVRDILIPLSKIAEPLNVAVVGVMHPGKGNQDLKAFQRLLGASAFGNVARCVWLACESPDNDGKQLLGVDKSNLAMKPKPLLWSRGEDEPIVWHGESEAVIGDVFGTTSAKPRDDAEGWLNERLKGGLVATTALKAEADVLGFKWRTVERAKERTGIIAEHVGGTDGYWAWKLRPPTETDSGGLRQAPLD